MGAKWERIELLKQQEIGFDALEAFNLTLKSGDALSSRFQLTKQKRAMAIKTMPRIE
jgi:hypothetical protein